MTTTHGMTAERLKEIHTAVEVSWRFNSDMARELLVEIERLTRERDEATKLYRNCRDILGLTGRELQDRARQDALEDAARLVETIVVSGPEDDEIDHDDYRDMQIASSIRALATLNQEKADDAFTT